jgi:hypothetical protein
MTSRGAGTKICIAAIGDPAQGCTAWSSIERALHVKRHERRYLVDPTCFVYLLNKQVERLLCRPVRSPTEVVLWQQPVRLG